MYTSPVFHKTQLYGNVRWNQFSIGLVLLRPATPLTRRLLVYFDSGAYTRRRELEKGFNGVSDERQERIRNISELAKGFLADYQVRQPKSATFAEHALRHVLGMMGGLMAVDVTEKTVVRYQTGRLRENAAPKTINDEVGFLLRVLPVPQAGAIRAQLRAQKQLRLRSGKRVGKAYTPEEKADLIQAAKDAPRSKAVHMATMFGLHAGCATRKSERSPGVGLISPSVF